MVIRSFSGIDVTGKRYAKDAMIGRQGEKTRHRRTITKVMQWIVINKISDLIYKLDFSKQAENSELEEVILV